MNSSEDKHIEFLKEKSKDAFLLAIEIFNKPTISYRLEGCVYFLCNAWELMFKAKMLMSGISIYYPNNDRTLSLNDCMSKVLTNKNDPVRKNLEIIINLRNMSTHDVIQEFDVVYMPFLSFNVKSYVDKMYSYFEIKITDYLQSDFLAFFTNNKIVDKNQILSKYGENIKSIFEKKISDLSSVLYSMDDVSIANKVEVNVVRVNNKNAADFNFYATRNPQDTNVVYLDRIQDINKIFTLTHHQLAEKIADYIEKNNINYVPINPEKPRFNTFGLDCILKKYDIKNNTEYCTKVELGKNCNYKYSEKLVLFIATLIQNNPTIIVDIKKS